MHIPRSQVVGLSFLAAQFLEILFSLYFWHWEGFKVQIAGVAASEESCVLN